MILTDLEIQKLLKKGLISIEPNPSVNAYDSTAVDLRLDPLIRVFRTNVPGLIFDPSAPGYKAAELIRSATDMVLIPEQGWDLPRGMLVLGWTKERVELDFRGRVAARVEGKSGLARLGLGVHITAPTVHAGFPGSIQLELVNHGPFANQIASGHGYLPTDHRDDKRQLKQGPQKPIPRTERTLVAAATRYQSARPHRVLIAS